MSRTIKTLFSIGFRPFFLSAAVFSLLAMVLWMGIYAFSWTIQPQRISAMTWHGHEMIYGYSIAIIAGFLLTAVRNWTGFETPSGLSLFLLLIPWLLSRFFMFTEWVSLIWIMAADILFILGLIGAISYPILKARQWRNGVVIVILLLLMLSNIIFYLGLMEVLLDGVRIGLYSGLYLIIALIILIGGRVIPFFTKKGIEDPLNLKSWPLINGLLPVLFISFYSLEITNTFPTLKALLTFALSITLLIRLLSWYTHRIWQHPLLWVLHIAYLSISIGFILKGITLFIPLNPSLSLHAFTYGGIGLSTLGMMSRVAWGHTGRNIRHPHQLTKWLFGLMVFGLITRVGLPIVSLNKYVLWMTLSQIAWILAFSGFLFVYLPILCGPRIENPKNPKSTYFVSIKE